MNIFFSKINKPYETLKSELENLDFRAGQEIYAQFMNSTLSNCKFDWFHLIRKIHILVTDKWVGWILHLDLIRMLMEVNGRQAK